MQAFSLSIPKPCHENWNAMTPQDRGRFCAACQKTVVDFTAMSDRQVADFFKRPTDNVCGRFHTDQLNRTVEPSRKRLPWIKHFFTIVLPALLVTAKVTAQGRPMLGRVAVYDNRLKGDTVAMPVKKPVNQTIRGTVRDENGAPFPGVSIIFVGTTQGTITDSAGNFKLTVQPTAEAVLLQVSSVGYWSKQVSAKPGELTLIEMKPKDRALTGEVVVVAVKKKPKKVQPVQAKTVEAPLFSVYPNPVSASNTVTLNTEKLEPGAYAISIVNNTGGVVQADEMLLAKGMKTFMVQLKGLPAGMYFLSLLNKATGKLLTQQLSVQ